VSESELDLAAILRTLNDHGIDYVAIGAVAVAGHGHVRGTTGVDVVPAPASGNRQHLAAALDALRHDLGFRRDFRSKAHRRASTSRSSRPAATSRCGLLSARFGVMQDVPGAPPYDELRADALDVDLEPPSCVSAARVT
jgi:hypothetical protein